MAEFDPQAPFDYKGKHYSVMSLDNAVDELFLRKSDGEKDLGIIDIGAHSSRSGYIVVRMERPKEQKKEG